MRTAADRLQSTGLQSAGLQSAEAAPDRERPHASGYRPEIDGLRAVAVVTVALFHGGVPPFSGGYVGVDVFFVISGYLITRIIAGEIDRGDFSIWRFYERRARRILPALAAMALFVIAFTLLYKTPQEARSFGESISFLAIFASNHFFLQEGGYFDAPLESFALLHTWSLAVEEQFYIVFPLLLLAIAGWARSRVIAALSLLAAVSLLAAAAVVSFGDQQLAFFAAPFRIWELLLGALLAIGAAPALRSARAREAAAAVGLALILGAALLFDETTPFPGLAALPPCLGAALLIHADADARRHGLTRVGKALAWRPVVFVGLVSYSFYLWHWPALSFAEYYKITTLETSESLLVLAVSFGVAVLSYYFVEQPFRRPSGVFPRKGLFAAAGATLALFAGLGVLLQETRGLPGRLPPEIAEMTSGAALEFGVDRGCPSEHSRLTAEAREAIFTLFCRIGDVSDQPRSMLWGDSHALGVSPGFDEAGKLAGEAVLLAVRAACPPIVGFEFRPTTTWRDCIDHNQALLDSLERLDVERVFLFAAWGGYANGANGVVFPEVDAASQAAFRSHFEGTIERIQAMGIEVVIGTSVPIYDHHVPSVMARAALFDRDTPLDPSRAWHDPRKAPDFTEIARLAEKYDLTVFPLYEQFCDATTCVYERDGKPLYADHGHLNVYGARPLGPAIADFLAF